jgi:microcystin-dependent protein
MPLLIGYDTASLDPTTRSAIDQIVASLQTWAAQIDGINAAERLSQLSDGIASLPTVQPGTILPYGGSSAPVGYLLCDGATVSRTTYATLFAAIGSTFGAGDGSTTFRIPDCRGRFLLGKAASGTGATLGSTGGALDHTHTGPSHTHTISASGVHDHAVLESTPDSLFGVAAGAFGVGDASHDHNVEVVDDGDHNHGGATGSGGTGNTGSANPAYLVVQAIIKT